MQLLRTHPMLVTTFIRTRTHAHTYTHTHTQWIATSATAHVLLQSGGESRALQTEWINKKQPRQTPADSENLHVYTRTLKHGLLHLGC